MGVFAEFERSMIQERVRQDWNAQKRKKKLGRPAIPPITAKKVRQLREDGLSFRKITGKVGIHHRTAQLVVRGSLTYQRRESTRSDRGTLYVPYTGCVVRG